MNTQLIIETAVKALYSKKAKNIVVNRIRDLTILSDYFIIANGTSSTQVKALADEVEHKLELKGIRPHSVEGKATGWILLDYTDVVIHVFSKEMRDYFDLERLWADGEQVDISDYIDSGEDE